MNNENSNVNSSLLFLIKKYYEKPEFTELFFMLSHK